jgi:hypothetical protein
VSTNERELSAREHAEMRDLVLAGTQHIRPPGAHRAQFVAVGVSLVLIGAVTGGIVTASLRDDGAPPPVATPTPNLVTLGGGSWVAYSAGYFEGDVYLVKPGSAPHRILGSDDDTVAQVCPAFTPDGTRLASGEATGSDETGWEDAAVRITDITAEGETGTSIAIPLDGVSQPPCPIWSADGRWLAFGADSQPAGVWGVAREVWVVDAQTGETRTLSRLSATDIEWATDGAELNIADAEGILVYSVADDATRSMPDTAGAVGLSASPDGTTLAVERRRSGSTERSERYDLWLMSLDGTERRILVEDYTHDRGIGPVWSPDGNRIVVQRDTGTTVRAPDEIGIFGENDGLVVVTLGDGDPLGPSGSQTVLAVTETAESALPRRWLPIAVSWAPDSASLRFIGWELLATGEAGSGSGLLTVPVDGSAPPAILWETPEGIGTLSAFPPNDFQSWSTP